MRATPDKMLVSLARQLSCLPSSGPAWVPEMMDDYIAALSDIPAEVLLQLWPEVHARGARQWKFRPAPAEVYELCAEVLGFSGTGETVQAFLARRKAEVAYGKQMALDIKRHTEALQGKWAGRPDEARAHVLARLPGLARQIALSAGEERPGGDDHAA